MSVSSITLFAINYHVALIMILLDAANVEAHSGECSQKGHVKNKLEQVDCYQWEWQSSARDIKGQRVKVIWVYSFSSAQKLPF